MPISMERLKSTIRPDRTIILLGAGASIPSGAPSGTALAQRLWKNITGTEPQSDDLVEAASILERRYGRKAIVDEICNALEPLQPTGGLLALPQFGWNSIFSTNFDLLMERAYKHAGQLLTPIRSNYDISSNENATNTRLYKIHGCITQDQSMGHKASMILTEHDYEEHERYRQTMFPMLQTMMLTNNVIIIGQSLRDRHLHDLVKSVLLSQQDCVNTSVYVLVYDPDDLRAPLLEDRGAKIIFGGIDEFIHSIASDFVAAPTSGISPGSAIHLPPSIVSTVHDVSTQAGAPPDALRMFNGGPATFSDIRAGATFERSRLAESIQKIVSSPTPLVAVIGAAGVGKTTFARQIALGALLERMIVWEHRPDFPFQSSPWVAIEAELRASGKRAVLLLDECTHYLRQANILVEALGALDAPALKIILTANAAQWNPRLKSPIIFKKGLTIELSRLDSAEINSLINLYQHNREVGALVQQEFRVLHRAGQVSRLREKCGADMFVCLKNIFARDSLDTILLTEFAELDENYQEYYRYVSGLEAVGMRVHRQLLMRMLNISAQQVSTALGGLSGIVDEYDIDGKMGIYGWSTRHIVIARKITDYKFSNHDDLEKLFDAIIDNINPAIRIELQSVRDLCDTEFGIGRLAESKTRQRLYKRLVEVATGERIPWHRLVRELLEHESLEDAEHGIRSAVDAVGSDGPLDRYKVRLLTERADRTKGIGDEDRVALTRVAYETAMANIRRYPNDKFSYRALCDVAVKLVQRHQNPAVLDESIQKLREAADKILDPDMDRKLRYYEDLRARM